MVGWSLTDDTGKPRNGFLIVTLNLHYFILLREPCLTSVRCPKRAAEPRTKHLSEVLLPSPSSFTYPDTLLSHTAYVLHQLIKVQVTGAALSPRKPRQPLNPLGADQAVAESCKKYNLSCPGSFLGYPPRQTHPKTPAQGTFSRHPNQVTRPPQPAPLNEEETYVLHCCSFGHYPELVTRGEGWT